MAFLQPTRQNIELRVSDVVRGTLHFGQVAVVIAQGFRQPSTTKAVSVYIELELHLFALNGTDLGDRVDQEARFQMVTETLDGANDTLVDAATGEILGLQKDYPDTGDWGQFCRSFGARDTMLQGDFFQQLRKSPVPTEALILHHLQAADAMGRFA
jgi:hypothetical protein